MLIVSHGTLSEAFLDTLEMIMGKQENACALSLDYGTDAEAFRRSVAEKADELDQGDGIIVFADLFGGTPSNSVIACMREKHFTAFAGVNLPMLIECAASREDMSLAELVDCLEKAGENGIINIWKVFMEKGGAHGGNEIQSRQ
jgi:PTS system mannose-specific IIA component